MLRAQCVNPAEFDIYHWSEAIPHQQGAERRRRGERRMDLPQIDAKILKRNYGRVELSAQTYVDVADVLFRCTRHAPETKQFLQLLRDLEQGCNGAWHVRLAWLHGWSAGVPRSWIEVTHQVGCLQSSVGRHVLAGGGRHLTGTLRGELSCERINANRLYEAETESSARELRQNVTVSLK